MRRPSTEGANQGCCRAAAAQARVAVAQEDDGGNGDRIMLRRRHRGHPPFPMVCAACHWESSEDDLVMEIRAWAGGSNVAYVRHVGIV
jgi:hypothetical protein